MPWTPSDATRFTEAAQTERLRSLWASTANEALSKCLADSGNAKSCEPAAIQTANATIRAEVQKAEQSYRPPQAVAAAAKRGLELRGKHNRGGTAIGVARARDLSNRSNIPVSTLRRMASYFARHEVDKQSDGFRPGESGYPSAGLIAWLLWGGDAGRAWVESILSTIEKHAATEVDMPTAEAAKRRIKRLRKLSIDRVDLVDRPSNAPSRIVMWKRAEEPETAGDSPSADKKEAEMPQQKAADGIDAAVADVQKRLEDVQAELKKSQAESAELRKRAEAAEAKAAEAVQKSAPEPEPKREDVLKSLPEDVRKMFADEQAKREAAEATAKRALDAVEAEKNARLTREWIGKAEAYKHLPVKPVEFGVVLKGMSEKAPEEFAVIEPLLKKADELFKVSVPTDELGSNASSEQASAYKKLETMAKRAVEDGKHQTFAKAFAAIATAPENQNLYSDYLAEQRGA